MAASHPGKECTCDVSLFFNGGEEKKGHQRTERPVQRKKTWPQPGRIFAGPRRKGGDRSTSVVRKGRTGTRTTLSLPLCSVKKKEKKKKERTCSPSHVHKELVTIEDADPILAVNRWRKRKRSAISNLQELALPC